MIEVSRDGRRVYLTNSLGCGSSEGTCDVRFRA